MADHFMLEDPPNFSGVVTSCTTCGQTGITAQVNWIQSHQRLQEDGSLVTDFGRPIRPGYFIRNCDVCHIAWPERIATNPRPQPFI